MDEARPQIHISFELLPEGKHWRVGQAYRTRIVLKQIATGENDATYEVVDATSLEPADSDRSRFLRSEGGKIRI